MNFRKAQWLFPVLATLHNAEEAIFFRYWPKQMSRFRFPTEPGQFRFGVVVLTLLVWVLTWGSYERGRQTIWAYLTTGCMATMLANVFLPHIPISIAVHGYTPGLVTAVVLNLPLLSLLLRQALRERYVSGWKAAAYWVAIPILAPILIPMTFRIAGDLGF
jgi:hypothetical protein